MLLLIQLLFFYNLNYNSMASKYETQKYQTIKTFEEAELRFYPSVMKIQSNGEFGPLFQYISGSNEAELKIEMTTPVYQSSKEGKPIMEFVLPQRFNMENTPIPKSRNIKTFLTKSGYFLAIRFSGYATDSKIDLQKTKLLNLAKKYQFKIIGEVNLLVYNSPYRIFNRKNELLIEVEH